MGGNVFKLNKPIPRNLVSSTVDHLMGDMPYRYKIIGSAGKKDLSGDIDIAVEYDNQLEFVKDLIALLGKENIRLTGVISANVDIIDSYGNHSGDKVQVDFILGDKLEFMELYYYYHEGSHFKSAHRNIAINAVAAFTYCIESEILDDYNRPIEVTRYKWSPTLGLVKVKRTSRNHIGNGKTIKKQDETLISESYFKASDIAQVMFGVSDGSLLNSFESVYAAINMFIKDANIRKRIFDKMAIDFETNQSIRGQVWIYPEELIKG